MIAVLAHRFPVLYIPICADVFEQMKEDTTDAQLVIGESDHGGLISLVRKTANMALVGW